MEFDKQAGLGHLPHPQHGLPAASRRLAEIRFAGSGLIAPPGTAGRLRDARPGQAIPLVGKP